MARWTPGRAQDAEALGIPTQRALGLPALMFYHASRRPASAGRAGSPGRLGWQLHSFITSHHIIITFARYLVPVTCIQSDVQYRLTRSRRSVVLTRTAALTRKAVPADPGPPAASTASRRGTDRRPATRQAAGRPPLLSRHGAKAMAMWMLWSMLLLAVMRRASRLSSVLRERCGRRMGSRLVRGIFLQLVA